MNKPIMEIKRLNSSYKDFSIKDITFDVNQGDILGFVGRNGAGKSTTINTILGIKNKTSGDILFNGEKINNNNIDLFRQKVGYIGDFNQYYLDCRVNNIVDLLSSLYVEWDTKKYEYFVKDMFKIDTHKKIKELSTGNRVRLNIAIALSHKAELLILDEPTSGIDPIIRNEILGLLMNFAAKGNHAVLFSTHITQDIEKIANRVLCIVDGEIKLNAAKDEIYQRYLKIAVVDKDEAAAKSTEDFIVVDTLMDNSYDLSNAKKASLDEVILFYEEGGKNE